MSNKRKFNPTEFGAQKSPPITTALPEGISFIHKGPEIGYQVTNMEQFLASLKVLSENPDFPVRELPNNPELKSHYDRIIAYERFAFGTEVYPYFYELVQNGFKTTSNNKIPGSISMRILACGENMKSAGTINTGLEQTCLPHCAEGMPNPKLENCHYKSFSLQSDLDGGVKLSELTVGNDKYPNKAILYLPRGEASLTSDILERIKMKGFNELKIYVNNPSSLDLIPLTNNEFLSTDILLPRLLKKEESDRVVKSSNSSGISNWVTISILIVAAIIIGIIVWLLTRPKNAKVIAVLPPS